jgi:hypothetical protein
MAEGSYGNSYRCLSVQILTRLCEYSDGGMTLIMYTCIINLKNNLNSKIFKSLKKETQHLTSLQKMIQVGQDEQEKLAIVSASFIVLSNLSSCWQQRKSILDKIMLIIRYVSQAFPLMNYREIGDKNLICLTLVLVSKFFSIFGSEKALVSSPDSQEEEISNDEVSKFVSDGRANLELLLNFLFSIINNPDTPNSCFLFSLDVL